MLPPAPVDETADKLPDKSPAEGQGDELPAEPRLHPEIDDDRYGDVDVKVPGEGELLAVLPQVAEGQIDGECQDYEPQKGGNIVHGFLSRIVCNLGYSCQSASCPPTNRL